MVVPRLQHKKRGKNGYNDRFGNVHKCQPSLFQLYQSVRHLASFANDRPNAPDHADLDDIVMREEEQDRENDLDQRFGNIGITAFCKQVDQFFQRVCQHHAANQNRHVGDHLLVKGGAGSGKLCSKSLKTWFIDNKIPGPDRDGILLLAEGSHVLWIVGSRGDDSCYVTDETRRILVAELIQA